MSRVSLEKRIHQQLLDMLGARDQAHAAGIIAGLHAAEQKATLLKWAEDHPEASMRSIETMWRAAGRGFREEWFNFSGAIEMAQGDFKEVEV